jgi:hypothetical protein
MLKKLGIITLVIFLLGTVVGLVIASQENLELPPISVLATSGDSAPTFYGEWRGYIWMYFDNNNANTNDHAYAYYQNLNTGDTGTITLDYYSTDPNSGVKWWKSSSERICGSYNFYQVIFSFYQVDNVPLIVNRYCIFAPLVIK